MRDFHTLDELRGSLHTYVSQYNQRTHSSLNGKRITMGKRNPNGYGCVTKLKGNRSCPWVVKATIYDDQGGSKQVPVGYAESEEKANILLAEYNNNPWDIDREKVTLAVLYQRWSQIKLPKLGKSN